MDPLSTAWKALAALALVMITHGSAWPVGAQIVGGVVSVAMVALIVLGWAP